MTLVQSAFKKVKRIGLYASLVCVMGVSLAACGDEAAPPTPLAQGTPATTNAPVQPQPQVSPKAMNQIQITLKDGSILPASMGIPAGKVKIVVVNEGSDPHNLVISLGDTQVGKTDDFKKGDAPKNMELDLKPGTYKMSSTIPGDTEKGMVGSLMVGR